VLENRAAVEAETAYAQHREFDRQNFPLFAARVIAGSAVDGSDSAVRKSPGVERGSLFRGAFVPKANYVFSHRRYLLIRQKLLPSLLIQRQNKKFI
jgi:hypothetical protein